ncbi:hypothetical protein DFQ26_001935 [Actinomortierella ambigua]|nr:hypothetical protein DFQ26_001935 [Actinomortierella ambigua]
MPRAPSNSRPRKNPDDPPRKNTKIDDALRERLIQSIFIMGMSVGETARRFGCHTSTIQSVIRVFEETGRMTSLPRGGNRKRALGDEQVEWVATQIDLQPELTIERMCALLSDRWNMSVPMSTLSRYITSLRAGYRLEPLEVRHITTTTDHSDNGSSTINDANGGSSGSGGSSSGSGSGSSSSSTINTLDPTRAAVRQAWANNLRQKHGSMADFCFVSITEFDAHTGHRVRALRGALSAKHQANSLHRSLVGAALTTTTTTATTKSGSHPILLVAMDKTGIMCSEVNLKPAGLVKTVQNFFLKKLVPLLTAAPPGIVTVDSEWFPHMNQEVRQALEKAGQTVLTFPSDNRPDLNAAHAAFRHVKLFVRLCDSQLDSLLALPRHMEAALEKVTQEKAQEWIAEADRTLVSAAQGQPATTQVQVPPVQMQDTSTQAQVPPVQVPATTAQIQVPIIPGQAYVDLEQNLEMLRQMLAT